MAFFILQSKETKYKHKQFGGIGDKEDLKG
jgi:hypothetical protein